MKEKMAADDFSHQHPVDVEAGGRAAEPSVGSAPSRRPPSTAVRPMTSRSVVLSRLQVERIDTVEGGGLSVLGLSLNNHCGVALIVFSAFFLLIGLILAVIAFSNSVRAEIGDDPNRLGFLQRNRLTLRVVGPAMLVSGFVMALCGVCFCALNWKAKQEEKEKQELPEYHCPLHDPQSSHSHRHSSAHCRNSIGSAIPLGVSADQFNSARNSFQASGGCDLCYERAKTAKSIQEYEETEKYLNTMGNDLDTGGDIACFPRPLTPNNTTGDFSLPGAAGDSLSPGNPADNNNDENVVTANPNPTNQGPDDGAVIPNNNGSPTTSSSATLPPASP